MKNEERQSPNKNNVLRGMVNVCIFFILIWSVYSPVSVIAQTSTNTDIPLGKRVFTQNPELELVQPEESSTIFGDQITVKTIVQNLVLINFERKRDKTPGEGHLHIWLDISETVAENAVHYYKITDYLFTKVKPGRHTLTVEVVNNDHSSFTPRVVESIHFTTILPPSPTQYRYFPTSPTPAPIGLPANIFHAKFIILFIAIICVGVGVYLRRNL